MTKKPIEITALEDLIEATEGAREQSTDDKNIVALSQIIIDAAWTLHTMKREVNMDADDKAKEKALAQRDARLI